MPGAGKQPPAVQEHIKQLLEAGFDPTTIHRRLKVGRSSIYRMKRSLQQHGTAYMPLELNKKNGRPKVLTPDQELEVRDWLRKPENRNRYLDDLVWLIHDRFNIVCSTTTMSKLKRKWLNVIEAEESGRPLEDLTRDQLLETHPEMPLLHSHAHAAPPPPPPSNIAPNLPAHDPLIIDPDNTIPQSYPAHPPPHHDSNLPANPYPSTDNDAEVGLLQQQHQRPSASEALMQQQAQQASALPAAEMQPQHHHHHHHHQLDHRLSVAVQHLDPAIDQQLQRQIERDIAGGPAS